MPKNDQTNMPLTSEPPLEVRKDAIKELFPEVFSEDKIDFEKLRQALGDDIATGRERYGLSWAGKSEAVRAVQIPSVGTLIPDRDESVDFDTTENLFIEGDNLEILKLLQKSYYGKIKMIYIDPPYNTGNEFIYPDNFKEGLQDYLVYSGQVDDEGARTSTSTDTSGRIHSKWLSMMYPRIFLARNLLAINGVIVVSIDDHEVNSLCLLLNEIFGEENFIAQLIWKGRQFPDSRSLTRVSTDHEYLLVYGRSDSATMKGIERDESKFQNPDNDSRGAWMSRSILGLATAQQRPNLHFDIVDPATSISYPPSSTTGWRYSRSRIDIMIQDGRILFPKKPDGRPREKKFRADLENEFTSLPSIIDDIFTAHGTAEIRNLFGCQLFDFPKPSALLKLLTEQITGPDDIVMDFFSGSCPLAQAIMEHNSTTTSKVKYICIQLPEKTNKKSEAFRKGYKTIADIGKERIRRVIKKLKEDKEGKLAFKDRDHPEDLGFRVFKLGASNFKIWQGDEAPTEEEALGEQLKMFADHVLQGKPEEAVLYELILKSGLPLTAKIKEKQAAGKKVYLVGEDGVRLAICLEKELTQKALRAMMEFNPQRILCLDSAFEGNDQLKTNTVLEMKSHEVEFRTV